jgi:hypothetical protein
MYDTDMHILSSWTNSNLSRRGFLSEVWVLVSSALAGCASVKKEDTSDISIRLKAQYTNMSFSFGWVKKPMSQNISFEWPDTDGNYIFIHPHIRIITKDPILIRHDGTLITKSIRISLDPFDFLASIAKQKYGLEDGQLLVFYERWDTLIVEK